MTDVAARLDRASPHRRDSPLGAVRELWEFRELFYYFAWRDIKVRYKQTVLGALWAIIQPLFTMLIFTFLFGRVAGISSDGIPRPLFYFSALVPWTYFSATVSNVSMTLLANSELLTKIYFPRVVLPGSVALSGLLDFLIASTMLAVFFVYYEVPVGPNLLLWIPFTLAMVALALGVGMFLAALNVKYRDIKYAVPFGIQLWLFVTPIIYPLNSIPHQYRVFFTINPLSGLIEGFRRSLIPGMGVEWGAAAYSLAAAAAIFVIGAWFFNRSAKEFADYL